MSRRGRFSRGLAGAVLALALGACAAPTAEPPRPSGTALETGAGTYVVTFRTTPAEIPLNEPFELDLTVRRADGGELGDVSCEVDATMPAHRHGMLREPVVEATGPGAFRVRGLLLHMGGSWVLTFDVHRAGRAERARWVVEL